MVYTIGFGWLCVYLVLGLIGLIVALYLVFTGFDHKGRMIGGLVVLVMAALLFYLAVFAGTHFRVGVNQRALLVDTVNQRIIGVRESGIQSRPLIGVKPIIWPANKSYQIFLDLEPGTASASSEDKISLWVDTKCYLDLSQMDLEAAYRAVNGDWGTFYKGYLESQLMNEIRRTSSQFSVSDHSEKRDLWAAQFDEYATAFFANKDEGYGIQLFLGRTIMSWDFVNPDDATAYDLAHRSVFLVTQRENEQAALNIEAEMAETRADMLGTTAQGTIDAWTIVADYIRQQPPEVQTFLTSYMGLQSNMEYLRMVSQQKPSMIFPPGQMPMVTVPLSNPTSETASATTQTEQ